jgi:hypothetical protein
MFDLLRNLGRVLCLALAWSFLSATLYAESGLGPPKGFPGPDESGRLAAEAAAQAGGGLRGQVTDPSGAAVPAVTVTVIAPGGAALVAQTDEEGRYVFRNLPPGAYTVQILVKGFASFEKTGVAVSSGQVETVDAKLEVAVEKEEVTVTDTTTKVSTNPENNASALVIKGKDLEALSDDPDELASELQALAGPSAGPNGGQIYIDGFTGGQLPPKSAILEIRVNQNPFSAEYDRLGFGRVEITTKPAYAQYHGQFFVNGNASALNTRSPYAATIPPYHSEIFDGNFGGPLFKSKRASFFFDAQRRNIQDESIVSAEYLDPTTLAQVPYNTSMPHPQTRTELSPRVDFQLSNNNVLSVRYQFEQSKRTNDGVGQFNLVSLAYDTLDTENSLQLSDTQVISPKMGNQFRFRYRRETTNQTPLSTAPTIAVQGAFTGGGNNSGKILDTVDNYEFTNLTSITWGKHSAVFGGRVRGSDESQNSTGGFNSSFTFPTLLAYQITEQGLRAGQTPAQIRAAGGGAEQFRLTTGNPLASVNLWDAGLYTQDDWRVRPNLTFSLGLRFETQNDIGDHADWAPRLGLAWGLGHSAKPSTVLRAGFGVFYDRFGQGPLLQVERLNGINQQQYIVPNPDFFPSIPAVSVLASTPESTLPTRYRIDPNLRAPYTMQSAVALERQIGKNATMSATYLNTHGVHQLVTNDINAPLPGSGYTPLDPTGGLRPFGHDAGNIYQYESVGLFNQNQLIANFSIRSGTRLTLNGFYTLNYAKGNTSNPMNPYNLAEDYGRAAFDTRHRVFLMGSIAFPRGFRLSPFMVASSGVPFNIWVGQDLFGTAMFNSRPGLVAPGTTGPGIIATRYGTFNALPLPGEELIPPYYATGPGQFSLNMRLAKTFGFGKRKESGAQGGPGGRMMMGGGPRGGPPGGGLGPGGLSGAGRGGFFFGGPPSNARYNLEFSINGRNILNIVNPAAPISTLGSPLFGHSNQLAGAGFFAGTASNRRLDMQVRFSF